VKALIALGIITVVVGIAFYSVMSANEGGVAGVIEEKAQRLASPEAVATVDMMNHHFEPADLKVRVGDRVRWVNRSANPHSVTTDPTVVDDPTSVRVPKGAIVFDSGSIEGGDEFTHVFEVPGEYVYVCKLHVARGMVGTVLVVAAGESADQEPPTDEDPASGEGAESEDDAGGG
jgi:plastocyanin